MTDCFSLVWFVLEGGTVGGRGPIVFVYVVHFGEFMYSLLLFTIEVRKKQSNSVLNNKRCMPLSVKSSRCFLKRLKYRD